MELHKIESEMLTISKDISKQKKNVTGEDSIDYKCMNWIVTLSMITGVVIASYLCHQLYNYWTPNPFDKPESKGLSLTGLFLLIGGCSVPIAYLFFKTTWFHILWYFNEPLKTLKLTLKQRKILLHKLYEDQQAEIGINNGFVVRFLRAVFY